MEVITIECADNSSLKSYSTLIRLMNLSTEFWINFDLFNSPPQASKDMPSSLASVIAKRRLLGLCPYNYSDIDIFAT